MALTTGTKNAAGLAASWVIGFGLCGLGFYFQKDLSALLSRSLEQQAPAVSRVSNVPPSRQNASSGGEVVELRAGRNGHFRARARINGQPIDVMVDTGATSVALSFRDAERAGIFLKSSDFTNRVYTANGIARVAPVTLSQVEIGSVIVHNVRGVVTEPGRMRGTLLGMSFLSRLESTEIKKDRLILRQ